MMLSSPYLIPALLDDFRRERDDLHEPTLTKLSGHRPEDARADRLAVVLDQHRGVGVEPNVAAVFTTLLLGGPHDHRFDHLALLDRTVGLRLFDRRRDRVAQAAVLAGRTTPHVNAEDLLGARVVGHVQDRSHLNHGSLLTSPASRSRARASAWSATAGGSKRSPPGRRCCTA